MKIHGTGIDLVEIPRFREVISRQGEAFLTRIFTAVERSYCEARKDPVPHFAVRFAAKEAVAKAFGTGIGAAMAFLEIEVTCGEAGVPVIVLHGAAKEHAASVGAAEIHLSLTHTDAYAAANALVVSRA
ncbi:MAG: holo-ACP synthase [Verrucomicrobiota bacterium]